MDNFPQQSPPDPCSYRPRCTRLVPNTDAGRLHPPSPCHSPPQSCSHTAPLILRLAIKRCLAFMEKAEQRRAVVIFRPGQLVILGRIIWVQDDTAPLHPPLEREQLAHLVGEFEFLELTTLRMVEAGRRIGMGCADAADAARIPFFVCARMIQLQYYRDVPESRIMALCGGVTNVLRISQALLPGNGH